MPRAQSSLPPVGPSLGLLLVDSDGRVAHENPAIGRLLRPGVLGVPVRELLPFAAFAQALEGALAGAPRNLKLTGPPLRQELLVSIERLADGLFPGEGPWASVMLLPSDAYTPEADWKAALQFRTTIESVISGFAHEVRNPVAAILSITEAALAQVGQDSPVRALLDRVPQLVSRVDKLIDASLSYSRPRSPRRAPRPVGELIAWAIELSQIRKSEVQLEVQVTPGLGQVLVDAEQIEQVLSNLLRNAYEMSCRRVTLMAERRPAHGRLASKGFASMIVIELADDGLGVREELRHRIFEPFFTTKAQGTGLGLAIARDLARINGGDLELARPDEKHPGASFLLCLEELDPPP
jgi:signal transduction histidine kinase